MVCNIILTYLNLHNRSQYKLAVVRYVHYGQKVNIHVYVDNLSFWMMYIYVYLPVSLSLSFKLLKSTYPLRAGEAKFVNSRESSQTWKQVLGFTSRKTRRFVIAYQINFQPAPQKSLTQKIRQIFHSSNELVKTLWVLPSRRKPKAPPPLP